MQQDEARAIAQTVLWAFKELHEDGVELWSIPRDFRRELPGLSDERVMADSRIVLEVLLAEPGIEFGNPDWDEGGFTPWETDDPVPRITAEWAALGRDPNMDDIGWLRMPIDVIPRQVTSRSRRWRFWDRLKSRWLHDRSVGE